MLFGADQQSFNWDMQQPNTQTPFASFQSQQPQQPPQQRLYQKNDASRMPNTRRYSSSGTSTPAQQIGYPMPGQQQLQSQQLIQNCRRVNPKGTYRSATFHQPTNTFPTTRFPQPAQQRPNGQLRTSSSFHGSLQSHGNQPYSGRSSNNGVHAAGQPTQKTSIYTAVNGQFCPGMKDVPIWLKSLRLHKYTRMFQEMTYEEMMALTDQKLEQRQVTKGARKKILNSIEKLQDRSQLIRQLEKCIDERGDVRCLIVELRAMMHTPIAAYKPDEEPKPSNYSIDAIGMLPHEVSDDNLAGLIARLCIRLHEFLFRNGLPQIQELGIEDDYLIKLLQVYEKILYNEAFTYRQRYCINECKRVLSRFMHEQKILIGNSSPVNGQNSSPMAPRQPTLVSSPSSGYQTISPPNSSTRRNSDTNSDTNSAPASPPAVHLLNQYQQQYSGQQTSNQTCPPPGFEWSASNNTNINMPAKAPSHFQPYVDSDVLSSGWYNHNQQTEDAMSTQNSRMWGQQPANKDDRSTLLALLDSNPILYNILLQQVQQQSQLQQPVQTKPPKPLSPIGTRPANYQQQQPTKTEASDIRLLEMVTNQLRQITNEDQGLETLNMALHYSMEHLKLNRQKETNNTKQQSVLWQNAKEPAVKRSTNQVPTSINWCSAMTPFCSTVTPKTSTKSCCPTDSRCSNGMSFHNEASKLNSRSELFDPWSASNNDFSLSDQLTASTTSTSGSDSLGRSTATMQNHAEGQNLLNRMMADPLVCGQSQQQQRIMRQYAAPDDLLMLQSSQNSLFSNVRAADDLRHVINEHQQKQFFDAFRPMCTSGAVH